MAKRVELARVGGGASEPAVFIALRARYKRVVVEAKNGIDLARLLLVWTELGREVALVCSFETRKAATSWVAGPVSALTSWAYLCADWRRRSRHPRQREQFFISFCSFAR